MTCGCPKGSSKISTRKKHGKGKGKKIGRGWACQADRPRPGEHFRRFVKATGC